MVRRHAWFHFPSFMPAFILLYPLSRSSYQHISSFTAFCSGPVTMVLLIAWWRYTALYLALLSLVCLPVAEMKHTADPHKPLSQNCIAKVQRTMDCVLSGPKSRWVNGKRINYDYMKVIGKSGWDTCNRPVADYVWNHSTDCARHHLKSTYSRQEMCKIIQGKKIMIVGDSINNQLFVTFASMMWLLITEQTIDITNVIQAYSHQDIFRGELTHKWQQQLSASRRFVVIHLRD
jgi:hypothetical protein